VNFANYWFAGEEEHTYGYGGTGKISTNCQFSDYGKPFQEGSVVGAFLVRFHVLFIAQLS
jgi:hypothetical protein